jgi:2,4-dienoyl-CoA reductase-like NADH-dependent reductase (Old Yellow Enzyme family)
MKAREMKDGVYTSKSGKDMFIYVITNATAEEKAKMREIKGAYYREDASGNPLFYSTRYVGPECEVVITTNDNIIISDSNLKKMKSLAAQTGADLGSAVAAQLGAQFVNMMLPGRTTASVPAASVKPAEEPAAEPVEQHEENLGQE